MNVFAIDFDFPQFGGMGRRRQNVDHRNNDFFDNLPSEFRRYMPTSFDGRHRNSNPIYPQSPGNGRQSSGSQGGPGQYYTMSGGNGNNSGGYQSPNRNVVDAAIQTEDPPHYYMAGMNNPISQIIPPSVYQQQQPTHSQQQPQQQYPLNGKSTMGSYTSTLPQPNATASGNATTPHYSQQHSSTLPRGYYSSGQVPSTSSSSNYAKQKQHNSPSPTRAPVTGANVRHIPIFVEGRSEPLINTKDIPYMKSGTSAGAGGGAGTGGVSTAGSTGASTATTSSAPMSNVRSFSPTRQHPQVYYSSDAGGNPITQKQQQQQQQHQQNRPIPLRAHAKTQHQQPQHSRQYKQSQEQEQYTEDDDDVIPPQTPDTMDSINRIQAIQHDVQELMASVETFGGTREDKEYMYLDEMLTRNLLKLDNIDTQGKDSIRLARKEAIKCIQASINVLEAIAEENKKRLKQAEARALVATDVAGTAGTAVILNKYDMLENSSNIEYNQNN